MASWMVEYLQKIHTLSVGRSTQALSLFFGLVMVGRLVGSFFIERVGYLHSVLWASLAGSACLALGLYAPGGLVILIPASGFFLSIIFPTITAAVSSAQSKNLSTTLGLLFTFAGFGGILGPWLVGVAGDVGGIQFGFSLNLAFCLLTAAAVFVLLRLKSGHT
jgi:fucose permease